MSWSNAFAVAVIALHAFGTMAVIGGVGKPRGPITGGSAIAITIINVTIIVGLIAFWPWGGAS